MPEGQESLTSIIDQVEFHFKGEIDINNLDPETTLELVRRITQVAYTFNMLAIQEYGGRAGHERERGLTEHAVGAAFQSFGDYDPHPDPFDKAAMLLRGITQGHPFNDGNKRTGFLTAYYFLEQLGFPIPEDLSEEEVYDLCLRVSSGEIRAVEVISDSLKTLWGQPTQSQTPVVAA